MDGLATPLLSFYNTFAAADLACRPYLASALPRAAEASSSLRREEMVTSRKRSRERGTGMAVAKGGGALRLCVRGSPA